MPPRGSTKRQAESSSGASATKKQKKTEVGEGGVSVQLVEGEQDAHNLDFNGKVQASWSTVKSKWPNIQSEAPPKVTEGAAHS